jgi:hypothetical protein
MLPSTIVCIVTGMGSRNADDTLIHWEGGLRGRHWRPFGTLQRIAYIADESPLIGAGHFGIIVGNPRRPTTITKLLYDVHACAALTREVALQHAARAALTGIAEVPRIHSVFSHPTEFQGRPYLCGISMDRVPFPDDFSSCVHMMLGYSSHDIDMDWGRDLSRPVGPDNPTRGFHAGPAMLEAIWTDEGAAAAGLTIESVAHSMGRGTAAMLAAGILPLDVEWIYGGNGRIFVIDFGLCEFRTVDPHAFLTGRSSQTLGVNYYVPKPGMHGHLDFVRGYWSVLRGGT